MNNEEPMNNEPAKELTDKELEGISGGNNDKLIQDFKIITIAIAPTNY